MNWTNNLFTGKDNKTHDLGRVLWFLGTICFLVFEAYDVWNNKKFDMTGFGLGFGGLLMTGGGALLLKQTTEPDKGQG